MFKTKKTLQLEADLFFAHQLVKEHLHLPYPPTFAEELALKQSNQHKAENETLHRVLNALTALEPNLPKKYATLPLGRITYPASTRHVNWDIEKMELAVNHRRAKSASDEYATQTSPPPQPPTRTPRPVTPPANNPEGL